MVKEKKYKSHGIWMLSTASFCLLSVIGMYINEIKIGSDLFVQLVIINIFISLVTFFSDRQLYLSVLENRTLINSGFSSFKKDQISIYLISNIYRVQADALRLLGNYILIIHRGVRGENTYIRIRESAYTQETIKSFLQHLLSIKPDIKLDNQYKLLLEGKFDLSDELPENYIGDIKSLLEEK